MLRAARSARRGQSPLLRETTAFDSRSAVAYLRASMTDVKTLAVVGAGQMGAGIAQVAAQSGLEVFLVDLNTELVQKALAGVDAQLQKAVGKGKISADAAAATLRRLKGTGSMPASSVTRARQARTAIARVVLE